MAEKIIIKLPIDLLELTGLSSESLEEKKSSNMDLGNICRR